MSALPSYEYDGDDDGDEYEAQPHHDVEGANVEEHSETDPAQTGDGDAILCCCTPYAHLMEREAEDHCGHDDRDDDRDEHALTAVTVAEDCEAIVEDLLRLVPDDDNLVVVCRGLRHWDAILPFLQLG